MRYFFLLSLLFSVIVMAGEVKVYYFHNQVRCITCKTVEANTKKIIEENYSDKLKNGMIEFIVINIDDPKNVQLVEKNQVFSSTLLLIGKNKNGTFVKQNITKEAFMNARNYQNFEKILKTKINAMVME